MNSQRVVALLVHALVCVLYIVINGLAVPVYKELVGGLTSRGVAIGMAMYLIFYFFVIINALLVFIDRQSIKFAVVVFMMLSILFYLLPNYPVRAVAYCTLAGGLSMAAIVLARMIHAALIHWRQRRAGDRP